jgi:undecaprenyl-diphosphatase
LSAGALSAINYLLKWVINRPRPTSDLVHVFSTETGKGFPSGHAVFVTLVLGILAYLITFHMRKGFFRTLTVAGFLVLILLVGVSRVYLGVHSASDVVGGYLIGTIFLLWILWSYKPLNGYTFRRPAL